MPWFIRGIRRGVVTTRYPARPDESARFLPVPSAFRPRALTRETAVTVTVVRITRVPGQTLGSASEDRGLRLAHTG